MIKLYDILVIVSINYAFLFLLLMIYIFPILLTYKFAQCFIIKYNFFPFCYFINKSEFLFYIARTLFF